MSYTNTCTCIHVCVSMSDYVEYPECETSGSFNKRELSKW